VLFSPELIRNRVSNRASGRAELIHRCCSNRGVYGCDVMRVNELLSLAGLEITSRSCAESQWARVLGRRVASVHLELVPP
jgi:LPS sulfotransferase NodH